MPTHQENIQALQRFLEREYPNNWIRTFLEDRGNFFFVDIWPSMACPRELCDNKRIYQQCPVPLLYAPDGTTHYVVPTEYLPQNLRVRRNVLIDQFKERKPKLRAAEAALASATESLSKARVYSSIVQTLKLEKNKLIEMESSMFQAGGKLLLEIINFLRLSDTCGFRSQVYWCYLRRELIKA